MLVMGRSSEALGETSGAGCDIYFRWEQCNVAAGHSRCRLTLCRIMHLLPMASLALGRCGALYSERFASASPVAKLRSWRLRCPGWDAAHNVGEILPGREVEMLETSK